MFSLYEKGTSRRRRQWNPTTIAASIVAHAAVVGAIAVFAQQAEARTTTEEVIAEWKLDDKPKPPPPPPPPPPPLPPMPKEPPKVALAPRPEPPQPRLRRPAPPVQGNFVTPKPPEHPPIGIPAPDPNARPITEADVTGVGKEGDVVGDVDPSDTRAPTGNTEPAPPAPPEPPAAPANEGPMEVSEVDVRPSLRNGDDVQRQLERLYPPALRDAGVTGETVLQFVIDADGRVEPGSIEVVSSSDEGFSAVARRIAAAMRFSPAKSGGHNVRVTTTMPVQWAISR